MTEVGEVAERPRSPDGTRLARFDRSATRASAGRTSGGRGIRAEELTMNWESWAISLWAFALMLGGSTVAEAATPDIWLAGIDPVVAADRQRIGEPGAPNDFMDLFRPDAPWTRTAPLVQVFKVSTRFLRRSTDAQLSTAARTSN
jgi:hypothetical protein